MRALLLVDLQNDFLPGGALPVAEGDQVIPIANRLLPLFELVVATQDWHPPDHGSFAVNHPGCHPGEVIELDGLAQVLWPVHCVQYSSGAVFAPTLDMARISHVIQKGTDPQIDSYSGFFDNGHRRMTGLAELLHAHGVDALYILGLATDYCVKYTALDARQLGFITYLVLDGCRGVNLHPGDVDRAINEMQQHGVTLVCSDEVAKTLGGQVD